MYLESDIIVMRLEREVLGSEFIEHHDLYILEDEFCDIFGILKHHEFERAIALLYHNNS